MQLFGESHTGHRMIRGQKRHKHQILCKHRPEQFEAAQFENSSHYSWYCGVHHSTNFSHKPTGIQAK